MKAILVIDMPTDCIKCPLSNGYCWNTFPTKGRADGCPLKQMPDIKTEEAIKLANMINPKATFQEFADGWNACLEEIQK